MRDFQIRQTLSVDNCSQCDCGNKRIIVNKHFYLCEAKNRERLQMQKLQVQGGKDKRPTKALGRKFRSIPKRSSSTYQCSNGERITQSEIEKRYKEVCREIDSEREPMCEGCGSNLKLSHSHIISQKVCKQLGKTELIWDKSNIQLHCFGSYERCHDKWERCVPKQICLMLDFSRNLNFIKVTDSYVYNKIEAKFEFDNINI